MNIKPYKKCLAFSLTELMVVVTIIAILSAISLPFYQNYINKTKITEIISIMSYYKLKVTDSLYNTETNDQIYNEPTNTIAKLVIKTIEPNSIYIIQAEVDSKTFNLKQSFDKPFLIRLVGKLQGELLNWHCEIQSGYDIPIPSNCKANELASL